MVRTSIKVFANVVFWVASAWLLISGFTIVAIEHTIENGEESRQVIRDGQLILKNIGAIGISVLMFYTNLYLLVRADYKRNLFATASKSVGLLVLAILGFNGLVFVNILPTRPVMQPGLLYGIFIFYYAISVAYAMGVARVRSEAERNHLILEKNQAELSLLRNQLQPHFLFNALNNLLSMLHQKHYAGASQSIEKLALLLRYVIEETKADRVKLSQEISFIKNYVALQMLRFDPDEVELSFFVEGSSDDFHIEPGLFLPFVENAFKYGTEPETKSAIAIRFDLSDQGVLHFMVTNPVLAKGDNVGTGTGLKSTRNRLQLVYPDRHTLTIRSNQEYVVHLELHPE